MRSTSTTRKKRVLGHSRRLAERATGDIPISPSRKRSHITLRLHQQQSSGLESAWWTPPEILGQKDDKEKQDQAVTNEAIRQAWLQRLRPRASHQCPPVESNETQKRKRKCKV
ncbi:hypothetical protein N7499_003517 [Penicillium canescens]|uniref:Uncharacterized protein n=1 Tax=Penicillium canescens TaxID=5083 RepID=A0AAD6IAM9_PENCN|nr:uncharacterized protein N7446_012443 [Penicillium canescens]KAJ6019468.1 hypothetical protein N7522_001535 [Penicillium canescens]KAJ6019487.1 hypothetical protein N7522_001554 [Penicillium canescens]KAJ6020227.1 hypothetical protein N7522_000302 [Penicillium canescens]KAJ6038181.1 hypothetical protein N7460_007952 [Penicillium canescens]KAJ6045579.1 hypothetical protein N7446_012443 [Penicillium canescens]